jgi:hypothetical protein
MSLLSVAPEPRPHPRPLARRLLLLAVLLLLALPLGGRLWSLTRVTISLTLRTTGGMAARYRSTSEWQPFEAGRQIATVWCDAG